MNIEEHLAPFESNGQMCVGGVPLPRLAAQVGSTPFFAYDRALVAARCATVRAAIGRDIELGFAVKANPMPALVQHVAGHVDWLDVASAGEMQIALDAGKRPELVSFAGPGKTDAELRRAVAAGVLLELESVGEARRVAAVGADLGLGPRVAVRVNPDFTVKGSGMRMSGGPQQFGIDVEQVPAVLHELADLDVLLEGFHVFAGSQNLQAEILVDAQRRTVELLMELAIKCHEPITYLNLGGGFGIPYFDRDEPLDLHRVGANLQILVANSIRPSHPHARIVVELGRYLVGEAGVYVTRVVDRKESRGRTYLVVDGGMHHQLAASGNFGQVIRRNYPITVADPADAAEQEQVTVVGSLCTPLDVLGADVVLPRAEPGDLVVLCQAGAYGLTASPTRFLGHPEPAEILV
ncbi:MAG TPA: pyridoxal-dependent decarboxylase, exosortase A system-associated [Nocardioides sp.]|nr:pyridoxal-dependent decarboxylase, exosortase A system-associated [Nocardioides sp.]